MTTSIEKPLTFDYCTAGSLPYHITLIPGPRCQHYFARLHFCGSNPRSPFLSYINFASKFGQINLSIEATVCKKKIFRDLIEDYSIYSYGKIKIVLEY